MSERQVVSVVWQDGGDIYVIYDSGEPDHMTATSEVAASFAAEVGLHLTQAGHGTLRWVRGTAGA